MIRPPESGEAEGNQLSGGERRRTEIARGFGPETFFFVSGRTLCGY